MKKAKQKANTPKATVRERLAGSFDTAKEVILDFARIEMLGNRELTVENYKSIVEYTEKEIILLANPNRIRICGTELEIKSIAKEMLYVTGKFSSVEFRQEV